MAENGDVSDVSVNNEVSVPAIVIGYHEGQQAVSVQFDPQAFRTWEFLLAVLEMARLWVEEKRKEAQLAKLQQQAAEAQAAQHIRRQLRG